MVISDLSDQLGHKSTNTGKQPTRVFDMARSSATQQVLRRATDNRDTPIKSHGGTRLSGAVEYDSMDGVLLAVFRNRTYESTKLIDRKT